MKKRICAMLLAGLMVCLTACGKEETANTGFDIMENTEVQEVSQDNIEQPAADAVVTDDASSDSQDMADGADYIFESFTDANQGDCMILHVSKAVVESKISETSSGKQMVLAGDNTPICELYISGGATNGFYTTNTDFYPDDPAINVCYFGDGAPDTEVNPDAEISCYLKFFDNGDTEKEIGTIYSGNTVTSIKDGYYSFYIRLSNSGFGINMGRFLGDLIVQDQEDSAEKTAMAASANDIPDGFVYDYEHIRYYEGSGDSDGNGTDASGYDIPESDFYVLANKDADSYSSHSGHFVYAPEDVSEYDVLRIEMSSGYALVYDKTSDSCVLKEIKDGGKEYTIPSNQIKIEGNKMDIFVDIPKEDNEFNLFDSAWYQVLLLSKDQWNNATQVVTENSYQGGTTDPENSILVIVE